MQSFRDLELTVDGIAPDGGTTTDLGKQNGLPAAGTSKLWYKEGETYFPTQGISPPWNEIPSA